MMIDFTSVLLPAAAVLVGMVGAAALVLLVEAIRVSRTERSEQESTAPGRP